MMNGDPKISVVMPVYNGEAYLQEAIDSVLQQTFREFEFIIINDGSTDGTAAILARYEKIDHRITVLQQENRGLISALNRGCRLASAKYIARMDADDVCLPERFARQWKYIEGHPQIGIVGTWIRNIKNGVVATDWCPPTNSKLLKWTHFFGVCVSHPTVLMRTEVIKRLDFYRHGTVHVEDVDLWLRASYVTEFGNIPEVLLKYRESSGSVTNVHGRLARESHVQLLASFIGQFLNVKPPIGAVAGLRQTRVGPLPSNLEQIHNTAELLQMLYEEFLKRNDLSKEERRQISWDAAKRVAALAMQASRFNARASVPLWMQSLKLDSRLLSPFAVMKGLRRAFET
jgi:glycosyltransferase involved in cell wall biosynthesis